jgi:hypothetical protein
MPNVNREFIPNQIFVGLPWKNARQKYDRLIKKLEARYPLHFTIVGRNDGQDAEDLFEIIKERISSSSYAIFDATGGNANVSLEFGYAEGLEVPRSIYLSAHKASQRASSSNPIISDLHGKRRVQYTNENSLYAQLDKFCKGHDFTKRFEEGLKKGFKGLTKGNKKRGRALAIKLVRALDGNSIIRRAQIVQNLQAKGYKGNEIEDVLKVLHDSDVVKTTAGRYADTYIA